MVRARRARLGAHMSVTGGFHRAVERALAVDATALQIFVKSARRWKAAPVDGEAAARFRDAASAAGLARHTLAHASYLINLASPAAATRERSIAALVDEIERCARLGVPFLVLHPGSHVGAGEEAGLERVARGLRRVLDEAERRNAADVHVLLENTAGAGTNLGSSFEHLGAVIGAVGDERLGVCFDTCHALAAGWELRTERGYAATRRALAASVGLGRVRAFHLNDSRHDLGSRRDRHEHVGKGFVGLDGFRRLLNDRAFAARPMVLETPKGAGDEADRRNLAALRTLLPEARR